MTDTRSIFEECVESRGWDKEQQVSILLEYVDRQASPEAFEDFIAEHFDGEYEVIDLESLAEDNPDEVIEAVISYIGNQQSNDVFEDYLAECENEMDVVRSLSY